MYYCGIFRINDRELLRVQATRYIWVVKKTRTRKVVLQIQGLQYIVTDILAYSRQSKCLWHIRCFYIRPNC